MKARENSDIADVLYILALAVFLTGLATGTSVELAGDNDQTDSTVHPGDPDNTAFVLSFNYGGDDNITGMAEPGTDIYSFEDNRTMFLNQSGTDTGVNGYEDGEDVLSIDPEYVGDEASVLNGTPILNFSSDVYFSDGAVDDNQIFEGNNSTEGFAGEIVVRSTSGKLGPGAEVLVPGNVSARDFHGNVKFIDGGDGVFASEDVLVNSSDPILDSEDRVIAVGSDFVLDDFNDDTTRYLQKNGSQTDFRASSAIVYEEGDNDNILERNGDEVKRPGKADILGADETNLLYSDQGDSAFTVGDPIYYSQKNNNYVNGSDIRLGDYNVSSRPVSQGVSLGLDLLSVMNSSDGAPETNDIGKSLNAYDAGSFRVLEYGSSTDSWRPENSDDQDVLIYDTENDGLSEGDVLLYNQISDNGTVEASVGTEFTQTDVEQTDSADNNYTVSGELGYNDTDEDSHYTAGDQVVLNISDTNQNYVVLGPGGEAGTLISDDYNNSLGNISRWDVDTGSDNVTEDGLYVAMNDTSQVSTGDVRLGHWNSSEASDEVVAGSLDLGANIGSFETSDNIAILDADHSDSYNAGSGGLSDFNGREAIISTSDDYLNSTDDIIREGKMPSTRFGDDMGYVGSGNGVYDSNEVILRASGLVLNNDSEVIVSGKANINQLQDATRYIESGEPGFHPGEDPLIHDAGVDGVLENGSLDPAETGSSMDYAYTSGEGNLQSFNRTMNETGDRKTVFLDSDKDGKYDVGEDVLEAELVTNGSVSDSFDGVEIFNFADSTKHTSETYSDGETIVNDTDGNSVYQNVFEGLDVENMINLANTESFFSEADETALESGLRVYRGKEYDSANLAGTLEWTGEGLWSGNGFSQSIEEDANFSIVFDAAVSDDLEDKVYGLKGKASSISTAGGNMGRVEGVDRQFIDAHAPELVKAWTGSRNGGDSSVKDKVYVKTNEAYSGLSKNDVSYGRFDITGASLHVEHAELKNQNNIVLSLNESFETNKTFNIKIDGDRQLVDGAGNIRQQSSTQAQDGLKPELESQAYRDVNEDGQVDLIELNFSENITYDTFSEDDWNVTEEQLRDLNVESGSVDNNDTLELEASADENITGVNADEPFLDYDSDAILDNSGNTLEGFNRTLSDRAAPVIFNATTGDNNSDSFVDRIGLKFTEPLDDQASELDNTSFDIGDAGEIEEVVSEEEDSSELVLEISSERGTDSNPSVKMFSNTIRDAYGNAIDTNQSFEGTVDTTNPVLLNAQINHEKSSYSNTFVDVRFSEPVEAAREELNLSSKELGFQNTDASKTHTVEYGELLPTGDQPNITGIANMTDSEGNPAVLEASENVTVNSFRKQLVEGWNFVSFPIADETTPAIEEKIDTSKVDVIWTYRNGKWQTYDPEASTNDFESFEGGVGYMIKASEGFVLNPNVNTVRTEMNGQDLIGSSTELSSGFNLIGPFQEHTVAADSPGAFGAINNDNVGRIYQQKNDGERIIDGKNIVRSSNDDNPGDMVPGEAYWMNWKEADSVTYSEPEP